MISKPSAAYRMLSRVMDNLLHEISDDDLADLHQRVETERNRRFVASRQRDPADVPPRQWASLPEEPR